MLSQGLTLQLRMGLRMELTGGISDTVFPKAEDLLLSSTNYQEALEFVADKRRMRAYESMMDYLFCESFPSWKPDCRRYYQGKGPQLIDHPTLTDTMVKRYDELLCLVLHGCLCLLNRKRRLQWEHIVEAVYETLREAA